MVAVSLKKEIYSLRLLLEEEALRRAVGHFPDPAIADTLAQVAQYKLVLQQNEHFTTADVYDARTLEDQETLVQYVTATIVLTLTQEVAE